MGNSDSVWFEKTGDWLPADKGRATVILDKAAYTEKANNLLKNTTTYHPSKADAAKKMSTRQVLRTAENSQS